MELGELIEKFDNVRDAYRSVDTKFYHLDSDIESLMGEVVSIIDSLLRLSVELTGRKIVVPMSGKTYIEISRDNAMQCQGRSCFEVRLASFYAIEIARILKDSDFMFARELKELLDIYQRLADVRLETHTAPLHCRVYVNNPYRQGVLEGVEASVYGAHLIVAVDDKRSKYRLDEYLALSIAFNCYDDFMRAIEVLNEKYKSLGVRELAKKLEEYRSLIRMYGKMMVGEG